MVVTKSVIFYKKTKDLNHVEESPGIYIFFVFLFKHLDKFEEMKPDRCDDDVVPPRKPNATSFQPVTGLAEIVNSNICKKKKKNSFFFCRVDILISIN